MSKNLFSKALAIVLTLLMLMASIPLSTVYAEEIPDGLSYEITDGEVTITDYTGSASVLEIPGTIEGKPVTSIGDYAFWYCTSLTSVGISNSVTSIGECAFWYCTSLTSVNIPDSVISIGDYAFWACESLTSVNIPNSVISIGDYAFWACTSLTSVGISNSVTSIGECAFWYCTSLTSMNIPDSATSIGKGAFSGCESLHEFTVSENNPAYKSIDGVLFSKDTAKLVCYPPAKYGSSYTISDGVTSIGDYAFFGCESLTSVNIPDSVTIIGASAFRGCESLHEFSVSRDNPAYKSIDGVLFSKDTTKLVCYPPAKNGSSYTIFNGVKSIGEHAFSDCESLTSVNIPDSVIGIGEGAFFGCESLTSVSIPDSVTSIGVGAFESCTSLTSITIPDSVTNIRYGAFSHCDNVTIYGFVGSYAEKYANENNIPFTALSVPPDNTEPQVTTGTVPTASVSRPTTELSTAQPSSEYGLGDVNKDGKVNIRDATLIQKYLAKLAELDEEAVSLADFDRNGKANVKDATAIQKFIAGIK